MGKQCTLGEGVVNNGHLGDFVEVGAKTVIGTNAKVGFNSKIGIECNIGSDSIIGDSSEIDNKINIGKNVYTGQFSYIFSHIAESAVIHEHITIPNDMKVEKDDIILLPPSSLKLYYAAEKFYKDNEKE